jgi:hypothetical protein
MLLKRIVRSEKMTDIRIRLITAVTAADLLSLTCVSPCPYATIVSFIGSRTHKGAVREDSPFVVNH